MRLSSVFVVACVACGGSGGPGQATVQAVGPSNHYQLGKDELHVITYDARARGAYLATDKDGKLRYCAEPSPDAVTNSSTKQATESAGGGGLALSGTPIKVEAEGSKKEDVEAASTVASVAPRTETVLVFREALYRLCELHLNGVYSPEETKRQFESILAAAQQLGQRELVGQLVSAMDLALQNPNLTDTLKFATVRTLVATVVELSYKQAGTEKSEALDRSVSELLGMQPATPADPDTENRGRPPNPVSVTGESR